MKRILALFLSISLTLCLFGCSSDGAYEPTGKGLYIEGQEATQAQEDATGKFLVLSYYPEEPLNPYSCNNYINRTIFSLVYQGLFACDRNYQPIPLLCKEFVVSADMRTYTFYLENATFSDGSKVTPADVMASLEAARKGKVYGARFVHVTDISLAEDGGITFKLDTAMESLPLLLDVPIVKAEDVEAARPTGTGPYFYSESAAGLRLQKRDDWWCSSDLMVTASSIPLRAVDSVLAVRDAFEFSDVGLTLSDPCSDAYVDYRCDYELWDCENGTMLYLACNMDSKVFSNEKIRSALTFAVDRQSISDTFYRGFAQPASLPASPSSPYYSNQLAQRYTFDKEKFITAVSSAALIGMEIEFLVNKDDTLRLKVARQIGQVLSESGLKVTMVEVSTNRYQEQLYYGTFDLYLGQTRLSPNMDLTPFFKPMGTLRYGNIADPSLLALCQQAMANIGNYYNLHENVMNDGRVVPILFHRYSVHATRGLLTGLTPARDNVFCYTIGKTLADVRREE